MLIYIKTVSESVKKWLHMIRLGNLLPHPLAFLSGGWWVGFSKIARLGNCCLVFLEEKCLFLVLLPCSSIWLPFYGMGTQ